MKYYFMGASLIALVIFSLTIISKMQGGHVLNSTKPTVKKPFNGKIGQLLCVTASGTGFNVGKVFLVMRRMANAKGRSI